MAGEKDRGDMNVPGAELASQLEAIHQRHLVVQYNAARACQVGIRQQLGASAMGMNAESIEFQGELQCSAERGVTIEYQDEILSIGHSWTSSILTTGCFMHVSSQPSRTPHA